MPSRFEYERAVRSSDLPSLSRLLALTVATWADVKTGVIPDRLQPSLTTLEEATGMARGSVRKHLDTLEEGGWLKRDRPSVAAARSAKARTKYTIKIPRGAAVSDTDGIELGQDAPSARAGDALDAPELGQELPQARAGAALALGQEMTTTRAGAALSSSYGPKTSVEYQLHRPPAVATPAPEDTDALRVAKPLIDEMTRRGMRISWQMQTDDWKDLIGLIHAHGAPALADHAERVSLSSKTPPYSARYFLAGWRGLAALPPGVRPLRAVSGGWTGPNRPHPMTGAAAQVWTADDYTNGKPF
jgi:hypothetical protein